MSVFDNARVGGHSHSRSDFFSDSVRLRGFNARKARWLPKPGTSSAICNCATWRTDVSPICRSGRKNVSSSRGR